MHDLIMLGMNHFGDETSFVFRVHGPAEVFDLLHEAPDVSDGNEKAVS